MVNVTVNLLLSVSLKVLQGHVRIVRPSAIYVVDRFVGLCTDRLSVLFDVLVGFVVISILFI